MHASFQQLDPDKQARIINAALEEFAKHGYDKASTNSIVKRAGISKGLLFHYFSNKQNLYRYLTEWAYKIVIAELDDGIDWSQPDFFVRLSQVWRIKAKVMLAYPYLAKFGARLSEDISTEAAKAVVDQYRPGLLADVYTKNIDFSKFHPDVPIDKAIKMTEWTMEKLGEEFLANLADTDAELLSEIGAEIDAYLAMLKRAFYKGDADDERS